MPLYDYHCPQCDRRFEHKQRIENRRSACCVCGYDAPQVIAPCHFDHRMGVDPDFPTAYAKWGKKHRALGEGRMRDSNQTAYGTEIDVEKSQYDARQRANR